MPWLLLPLPPHGRNHPVPLIRHLDWPLSQAGHLKKRGSCPALSAVAVPTALSCPPGGS